MQHNGNDSLDDSEANDDVISEENIVDFSNTNIFGNQENENMSTGSQDSDIDEDDILSQEELSLEDPIDDTENQLLQTKDQLLRTLAEMENLRRRTSRELRDAKQYAIVSFARDLLSVSDNFERALSLIDDTNDEGKNTNKAFVDGIELTARELINTMEKHGVKKIIPVGEKFDPNFHQAMFEAESDEMAVGMVTQVIQPGFVLNDRVLRPAMVGVSKGLTTKQPDMSENNSVDKNI